MSSFKNVEIVKKANIYFDGKVSSRTIINADGSKFTLGIMLPGEYEFNTADKEIMEFYSGTLSVLLPGKVDWLKIDGAHTFEVPANASFKLKVEKVSDYCCSFIK